MKNLLTIGDIARRFGVARHRLSYAVEKANIGHRGRAGILRLYGEDQVAVMQAALDTVRPQAVRVAAIEGVEPRTTE